MSTETEAFDAIVSRLNSPAYVVTTAAGAERGGCLVAFASQCSIEPPRFGVWLSKENQTYRLALSAATLVVHVLRSGDQDLALLFGAQTGDEVDKFQDIEWSAGPDGCPMIARCDRFIGSITQRIDTGDHVGFVLAPQGGRYERVDNPPLGIRDLGDITAGHPVPDG